MAFLLVDLCLFLLLTATGLASNGVPISIEEDCIAPPDQRPYSVDLLEGMKPHMPFPQESSPAPCSHAHLINSETRGYMVVNKTLAARVSNLSCSTQELAISANVVLLRGGFQPIIQIANPRHDLEGEMLLIAIDSINSKLFVSYHHQGRPHVERLPLEVPIRKWFHFVFVFSHNQFQLVQDCGIVLSQKIPTPDFCLSESVTISIGEVTYSKQVSIFQGALQKVLLIFGNGGYTTVCPSLDSSCTTCAETMKLKMRIAALEKERDDLELELDKSLSLMASSAEEIYFKHFSFFEDFKKHRFVTDVLVRSPNLRGVGEDRYNCLLQGRRYQAGEFFTHSFREGQLNKCCMCFFGKMICEEEVQRDISDVVTSCGANHPLNTVKTRMRPTPVRNECIVTECGDIADKGPHTLSMSCTNNLPDSLTDVCTYETDTDPRKRRQYHAAVCCGHCNPCEHNSCPQGVKCITDREHGNHSCLCPQGQLYDRPTLQCLDINECRNPKICPNDSTCIDMVPGYLCNCTKSGFRWNRTSNNCEDIDVCALNPNICPTLRQCVDTPGGYECNCIAGYQENVLTGNCERTCTPECQNGGTCLIGNRCLCPLGFTGDQCENDIDECKEGTVCSDTQECRNTVGSYFCRCEPGYRSNGSDCENIDECADPSLHYCDKGRCVDEEGSYRCVCGTGEWEYNCTGVCRAMNQDWAHGQSFPNPKNCKLCVCMHGLTVCTPMACDCSDYNMANSQCCSQQCNNCTLPDGSTIRRGSQGTTQDGCTACMCKGNGKLECVNRSCPSIDYCPEELRHTPEGMCCPTCKVPVCPLTQQQGMNVTIDNGCRECECKNGIWTCGLSMDCPSLDCEEEERVFEPGQCCPRCRPLTDFEGVGCPN